MNPDAIKTGSPAYPELRNIAHRSDWDTESGMTLRDKFADSAMQGLLARGIHYQTEGGRSHKSGLEECDIAGHAYAMADAMLKARES